MNMADTERKGILGTGKSRPMGSEVQVGVEYAKYYELQVVTGQKEGAGGVMVVPISKCLGNSISSLDCTYARQMSEEVK